MLEAIANQKTNSFSHLSFFCQFLPQGVSASQLKPVKASVKKSFCHPLLTLIYRYLYEIGTHLTKLLRASNT